jgi:chaperone modulatory protein CbpM
MRRDDDDVLWLDEHAELSLRELADLARLSEADVLELVECGVIAPAGERRREIFAAYSVAVARTARRLRADFELDMHSVALALELLERIRELEAEVRTLRAQLPGVLR